MPGRPPDSPRDIVEELEGRIGDGLADLDVDLPEPVAGDDVLRDVPGVVEPSG